MSDLDAEDRRVQRTRAALLGAFVHLVLDRRYDQITVADIVERAGVGRSTFYEHYENKDELLKAGLMGPFAVLADMVAGASDPAPLRETIEHFWENRRVGNVLFSGPTRQLVTRTLAAAIEQRLTAARGSRREASGLPVDLVSAYLAAAQVGLLAEWLSGHSSCPADVVATALQRLAVGAMQSQLAASTTPRPQTG